MSLAEAVSLGDLQHPQSPEEPIVLHISGAPALDTDAVVELNAAVALGMSTTLEAALEWIARIK